MPAPYKIFTIYAREDAQYLEELRGQLRPLENAGRIKVWSDREINPGVDWEQEIVHNLDTADIILILVSAAYYNSAYIHEKEIKYALARHEQGQAKVLPIIVRPVDFSDDPVISRLQVLPTDGKPVNDRRHWQERDDAWLDVVAGIKRTLDVIKVEETRRELQARAAMFANIEKEENKRQVERDAIERAHQAEIANRERQARKQRESTYRIENERLAQIRMEQERHREETIWEQAINAHVLPAYENYCARYPQGKYAKEAQVQIKKLKRKDFIAVASAIGLALILLLVVWLGPKMLSGKKQQRDTETILPTLPKNSGTQAINSGLIMVPVEGGSFMMGSPATEKDRNGDECQHPVTVQSFNIGKFEVTQADWRNIMGNEPSYFKGCDDCPVEQVSWDDVQEFIKKLNAKFPGLNYRLPSEAEWEYAARGGKKSTGYHSYAGANDLNTVGWYADNWGGKPHPVGSKTPNELGLYDMSGNVWEWCQDTWKPYSGCSGTAENRQSVLRGGCLTDNAPDCRAANRDKDGRGAQGFDLGFRLVSVSLQ